MKRTLHREKAGRFCDLKISLENGRLSICGSEGRIVNAAKREESCGQIRDTLLEWFPECEPYLKWHLNDMKAGTPAQEAELARHEWDRHGSYYDWACARLSDAGVLVDNGYKYGSAWLKVELPPEVVKWAQEVTA